MITTARKAVALATGFFLALFTADACAQCGIASWYALHAKTASGERMNPADMTGAHRTLALGTTVTVINQRNGKSVVVRINDRGPFIRSRVIDLSKAAASKLDFVHSGTAAICMLATPPSTRLPRV
jgi:rare lipoprotein A